VHTICRLLRFFKTCDLYVIQLFTGISAIVPPDARRPPPRRHRHCLSQLLLLSTAFCCTRDCSQSCPRQPPTTSESMATAMTPLACTLEFPTRNIELKAPSGGFVDHVIYLPQGDPIVMVYGDSTFRVYSAVNDEDLHTLVGENMNAEGLNMAL
jgi:hypothetical protein